MGDEIRHLALQSKRVPESGWSRSATSRIRRALYRGARIALGAAAVVLAAVALSGDGVDRSGAGQKSVRPSGPPSAPSALPLLAATERVQSARDGGVREAIDYAQRRTGLVSVAVIDSRGDLRGWHAERRYVSASLSKAMLLAAELRRLRRERLPLDAGTRDLLERMITWSDNDAADAIYARVGDRGLYQVARAIGMRDFSAAGHWSVAQISARDMARLMYDLGDALRGARAGMARRLLANVVATQRWGIPDGIGKDWRIYFKGGWRATELGQLVHQAALLERGGRRLAVAVLTDAQPSHAYGVETLRGIARRLVG
jgi:beta-lactamase class A